ncbi:MAG: RNA polymerase sigma factor [Calditrichia bacterium]|nr:RNA polymerase sigma factor [Calditrichia bacterium]
MIPEPSKDLIQQSKNGDLQSFKNLYRHYEKTIYGFCLRMLNNQQDAEDAVQTIFLKLFRNIAGFNYQARFTTYLFTIARNACYDILNQRKNMNEDLDKADHISGNTTNLDHDISGAISKLPERTRECFIMFAIEGYPQEQIAKIMSIKTGTVKALIFQARQKLRTWLSE